MRTKMKWISEQARPVSLRGVSHREDWSSRIEKSEDSVGSSLEWGAAPAGSAIADLVPAWPSPVQPWMPLSPKDFTAKMKSIRCGP